ncbi:MAG: flagellar hook capping FlgD N-terminal domain-containing protein [Pseudomonadota bacterium]
MYASPIDTSTLGSAVGSTTAKTSNNASDPEAAQDRFLKLLVAQINSQDPLNPMDNAQMTSQMAQINTVSGIQQLNETLKGMAGQFSSLQTMQGASLIGRDALVEGDSLSFNGSVGRGALDLPSDAKQVFVDIVGKNGELIDTIDMGARGAGTHAFEWDAGSVDVSKVGKFKVRATSGGDEVTATPLARLPVMSVGMNNGAMNLQLSNGRSIAYDQVRAFM